MTQETYTNSFIETQVVDWVDAGKIDDPQAKEIFAQVGERDMDKRDFNQLVDKVINAPTPLTPEEKYKALVAKIEDNLADYENLLMAARTKTDDPTMVQGQIQELNLLLEFVNKQSEK